MTFKGPFQPKPFYDSMTLWPFLYCFSSFNTHTGPSWKTMINSSLHPGLCIYIFIFIINGRSLRITTWRRGGSLVWVSVPLFLIITKSGWGETLPLAQEQVQTFADTTVVLSASQYQMQCQFCQPSTDPILIHKLLMLNKCQDLYLSARTAPTRASSIISLAL